MNYFLSEITEGIINIFRPPFENPDIFWNVMPLFVGLFVIELYFGLYKEEKLGWNTATGNGMILAYTGFNLYQYYTSNYFFHLADLRAIVTLLVLGTGLFVFSVSFFHLLPRKLDFMISSALVVDYLAYLGIIFVYGTRLYLDLITVIAALLGFLILALFFRIIQHFEPSRD